MSPAAVANPSAPAHPRANGSGQTAARATRTIKAAFHVHSEWSYDAHIPLGEIAALFAREGYDAVFMCEHDRGFSAARRDAYIQACREASAGGPLLVPGIEYADPDDRVHVPVWGSVPFVGERVPTIELLRTAAALGGAAVLAHPVRRDAWRTFDPEWLRLASGIEIWTRKWDGWAPNPRACRLAEEHGLVGVGALDLHRAAQMFPLAMELEVELAGGVGVGRADGLTVEACVEALRCRRAHATILGRPVAPLTDGPLADVARSVERVRRPLWRRGRVARERLALARRSVAR